MGTMVEWLLSPPNKISITVYNVFCLIIMWLDSPFLMRMSQLSPWGFGVWSFFFYYFFSVNVVAEALMEHRPKKASLWGALHCFHCSSFSTKKVFFSFFKQLPKSYQIRAYWNPILENGIQSCKKRNPAKLTSFRLHTVLNIYYIIYNIYRNIRWSWTFKMTSLNMSKTKQNSCISLNLTA